MLRGIWRDTYGDVRGAATNLIDVIQNHARILAWFSDLIVAIICWSLFTKQGFTFHVMTFTDVRWNVQE